MNNETIEQIKKSCKEFLRESNISLKSLVRKYNKENNTDYNEDKITRIDDITFDVGYEKGANDTMKIVLRLLNEVEQNE